MTASMHRRPDGVSIAYRALAGAARGAPRENAPTVVFFPGFASNMAGTKAVWLEAHCRERGQPYLRFDYQGHGESSGRFVDGEIGTWAHDAIDLLENVTSGRLALVGSSMGAWMALLAARALSGRVGGLVGVAAAPDFTEELMPARLDAAQKAALERDGLVRLSSSYQYDGEPPPYTKRLIDSGAAHTVLDKPLALDCPVRLIHGDRDEDVPWQHGHRLFEHLRCDDAHFTLVKGGDHRLSAPAQLALLGRMVDEVLDA